MSQKIAAKLNINGIQYKLKDQNAITQENLQQQGFATQTYVQGFVSGLLDGFVTQGQVQGLLDGALEGVATVGQVQGIVSNYLSNYPNHQEVDSKLADYVSNDIFTITIGNINTLLDTINGEQI